MVVGFWFFIITLRLSQFAFGKIINTTISIVLVFIAFVTLYIYVSICIAIRRRPRVAETREREGRGTEARVSVGRTNQTKESQNIKMAKSCGCVVAIAFICNVPFAFTHSLPTSNTISTIFALWSITLALSASSLNSLVFFWKNPILRKEAKNIFQGINIC